MSVYTKRGDKGITDMALSLIHIYIMPNPEEGTEKMLKISALDKQ